MSSEDLEAVRQDFGRQSVNSVREILEDADQPVPLRVGAVMEIACRQLSVEEKVAILLPFLEDVQIPVRQTTVFVLGTCGLPTVISRLWNCLSDQSPIVRGEALRALAFLGEEGILSTCINSMSDGETEDERMYAMSALSLLDMEAGLKSLEAHWLGSTLTHEERCLLASLLAKNRVSTVEGFLEQEMERCQKEGSLSAITWAEALLHFRNKAALSLIRQMLIHPPSEVPKARFRSLISALGLELDPSLPWEEQLSSWIDSQLG